MVRRLRPGLLPPAPSRAPEVTAAIKVYTEADAAPHGQDGYITFHRGPGAPRFYGTRYARGEHALLHYLKMWLNLRGFDLIKKRMQQDNHLMGDEYQPYLRSRRSRAGIRAPHIYIYSGFYALHGANEDWNKEGEVQLLIGFDIFGQQPDWWERLKALATPELTIVRPALESAPVRGDNAGRQGGRHGGTPDAGRQDVRPV